MILDPVGGEYIAQDLQILNAEGRLVVIGLMAGRDAQIDLARLLMKRQRIIGSTPAARPVPRAPFSMRFTPTSGPGSPAARSPC